MRIDDTAAFAEDIYRDIVCHARDRGEKEIDFESIWRLAWDSAMYFDAQLEIVKRKHGKNGPGSAS